MVELYDHLRSNNPNAPLFDTYASTTVVPPVDCLSPNSKVAERLGHSSDAFPLAPAQRDALSHLLAAGHGEILAVNGPPGTGKTTMLLSVVASLWAREALEGRDPPVIIASSTNNQAVTNIIDAFGKDFSTGNGPFAGRWLPDIKSFGAYFPSSSKKKDAEGKYQTESFFSHVETEEYYSKAEKSYLQAARRAFPNDSGLDDVTRVIARLQKEIKDHQKRLSIVEEIHLERVRIDVELASVAGIDPDATQHELQAKVHAARGHRDSFKTLLTSWKKFLANESVLMSLFNWLSPIRKKRLQQADVFLEEHWPGYQSRTWESLDEITNSINHTLSEANAKLNTQDERLSGLQALLTRRSELEGKWKAATLSNSAMGTQSPSTDDMNMAGWDEFADTAVRFPIFLLTTHYWEGRWLMEMKKLLPNLEKERDRTGAVAVAGRWKRRIMLTPCVVLTFFMIPKAFKCSKYESPGVFSEQYLYDFIDLLIVDEAGQALPEVAGPAFSLARRALVIGDTLQIEPIWGIPGKVDIGNLASAGLLGPHSAGDEYERLCGLGMTAAAGSVMALAQQKTHYHYDPDLARGMFLYDHRRCYDEIINYCNDLCYKGRLNPLAGSKVGSEDPTDELPAMGYLHIEGYCESGPSGGSRQNLTEARTIARWLHDYKDRLEAFYQKPLKDIVGVVTPFGAQASAICAACKEVGITAGKGADMLTVGTVHSLQGSERQVILFSPTYTKEANGKFIDKRASMLNVAVSRAKKTFLVFGDMDTFDPRQTSTPRGLLASILMADRENALAFPTAIRPDIEQRKPIIETLSNAEEHDYFLRECLTSAAQSVNIITPWFIPEQVQVPGLLNAMAEAAKRGVKITIYTDKDLNQAKNIDLAQVHKLLDSNGIDLVLVRREHSKIVTVDDHTYCVGSFNWLSAQREGPYKRHEESLVYKGHDLSDIIEKVTVHLVQRV